MDHRFDDGEPTDFERFLLESAAEERPSPELRGRVLSSLGIAAGAGTSLANSAAPNAAGTGAGASASGATAGSGALGAIVAKGLVVVAALGVATAVVVSVGRGPAGVPDTHPRVVTPTAPAVASAAEAVAPASERVVPPAAPDAVAPVPKARAAKRAPAPKALVTAAPEPPSTNVADEVAALDVARAALARGDAKAALAELSKYDARFPAGVLRREKTVLEGRALRAARQSEQPRQK